MRLTNPVGTNSSPWTCPKNCEDERQKVLDTSPTCPNVENTAITRKTPSYGTTGQVKPKEYRSTKKRVITRIYARARAYRGYIGGFFGLVRPDNRTRRRKSANPGGQAKRRRRLQIHQPRTQRSPRPTHPPTPPTRSVHRSQSARPKTKATTTTPNTPNPKPRTQSIRTRPPQPDRRNPR